MCRRDSRRENVECGLAAAGFVDPYVNQRLSQPLKCNPPTPHKAPKLAKFQEASRVGVRWKFHLKLAHDTALGQKNCIF